jgi:hypothetical protein
MNAFGHHQIMPDVVDHEPKGVLKVNPRVLINYLLIIKPFPARLQFLSKNMDFFYYFNQCLKFLTSVSRTTKSFWFIYCVAQRKSIPSEILRFLP